MYVCIYIYICIFTKTRASPPVDECSLRRTFLANVVCSMYEGSKSESTSRRNTCSDGFS